MIGNGVPGFAVIPVRRGRHLCCPRTPRPTRRAGGGRQAGGADRAGGRRRRGGRGKWRRKNNPKVWGIKANKRGAFAWDTWGDLLPLWKWPSTQSYGSSLPDSSHVFGVGRQPARAVAASGGRPIPSGRPPPPRRRKRRGPETWAWGIKKQYFLRFLAPYSSNVALSAGIRLLWRFSA